ncbi:DEAD/DEAH box helicase [Alicyclobacillus fastidiosus]
MSGEDMDDNQRALPFGLHFLVRETVDGEDQAVFSWSEELTRSDEEHLLGVAEQLVQKGLIGTFDMGARKLRLNAQGLIQLLTNLREMDEFILARAPSSASGRTLQQAMAGLRLAHEIVRARDILAGAFVTAFSVAHCLSVLRDAASSTDDVMPQWGSGNGTFVGMWLPAWSVPDFCSVRSSILSGFQSGPPQTTSLNEQTAIDWWIMVCVDAFVREQLFDVIDSTASSGQSYRVMYRGEADVFEAWRATLKGAAGQTFPGDGWLVARAMRQALQTSGWKASNLDDHSGKNFYTLSFQLVPPLADSPSANWKLVYRVKHRLLGWSQPIEDWWRQEERIWVVGEDTLVQPDVWMLPALRQAAAVSREIKQSFALPAPSGCEIAADDVYTFLTESVPRLRELGFSIDAPNVLRENGSRVRIRVRVKRPKSEGRRNGGSSQQWFDANRLVDFDWSIVIDDEEISREAFANLVANQTPFVQVEGSWRLIPVDEILRQVEELGGVGKPLATRVLDLSRAILMSSDTAEVPVQVEYQEEAMPIEHVISVLTHASNPTLCDTPETFRGQLRHYQQFGFSWLMHLRSIGCGACLADDMGLGKTVQVLAYLLELEEKGLKKGTHLLVCPTSLLPNWRAELAKFAPNLSVYVHHGSDRDLAAHVAPDQQVNLVMTTYATLVRDIELLQELRFDAVIVDEAQNIKNADTKQAQAIRLIHAEHRIALTGTPIENRLEELWALMDFLNPGYLGSPSWFRKTLIDGTLRNPTGGTATKLQVLLRPVLLRRRKSDPDIQTELPDKWEVSERALLTAEQAAMYQAMVDQLFTDIKPLQGGGMSRRGQILATLVRLKQICDHPCLISGGVASVHRSGKLRQLIELLQTVVDEGECALVFTQFRDMGEILCDTIEQHLSVRPKFLHGGLTASTRGQIVDDFQKGNDPSPILVLSLRAGGVGINLTRANHVFHFDRWWNPAVEDQATDRAYRIGQTKDVQVHKMICTGTLEERIDDLITTKRELSQAIVGGTNEWVTELDDDALRELFTLSEQNIWEEEEA